jgi:hypothetical protein
MTVAHYFLRGPETIAALFQRPVASLRRWDAATRLRPVVTIAALDAHARLPWRPSPDGEERTIAALPTYLQMFRTLKQAAIVDRPLSGNAAIDQDLVLAALHAGHSFSAITAFATPAHLAFFATASDTTFEMGDRIESVDLPVAWHARTNDSTARLALVHNGVEIGSGRGAIDFTGPVTAGVYRIEAYRPGILVPWLMSNPIFTGEAPPPVRDPAETMAPPARSVLVAAPDKWAIEKNETSTATLAASGVATHLTFTLGGAAAYDQFAAMSAPVNDELSAEGFDRVQFTIRAERPMRLSVQLRLPGSPGHDRWRHSVFADQTPRTFTFRLQDFQPADLPTTQRPIVAHVRGVLFVVDTLNNLPSTRGSIWVSDVKLGVGKVGG